MSFCFQRIGFNSVLCLSLLFVLTGTVFGFQTQSEMRRWESQAKNVSIVRDDWGIAHITGKTDADAVFGMIYAQCEDDFNRVETNYITSLGRAAEHQGEAAVWSDLRQKLYIQPDELKQNFAASPPWLQKLMKAWADGINFYLAKHPNVKPKVITKFEPWMALSFTEGSIGGDIESISPVRLRAFYEDSKVAIADEPFDPLVEPSGSNGFAIGPQNTVGKKALLLINPHTSFFFRSELQMTSSEGLNAYGAATWGQFFIYQGFNSRLGWMHTSSAADVIDEFRETVVQKDGKWFYKFGSEERPVIVTPIKINYKTATGMAERTINAYRTHNGPVVRKTEKGEWISVRLMHEPIKALMQSYGRTKAKNYKEFKEVMQLKANSSNATLYADADGNYAYFHVNYMPRRNPKFDWTKPVDGSDPESDYKGLHDLDELPNLLNPASGWVYNANNHPWSAAGPSSLKQSDYPRYVDSGIESARGLHAIRVLENKKDFTLESLNAAAYDSYLPWFEKTIPKLVAYWDQLLQANPIKQKTKDPIEELRRWDMRWSKDSVATTLAVFWAEDVLRTNDPPPAGMSTQDHVVKNVLSPNLLASLDRAIARLTADFGKWQTPWGDVNRFQRITGDIVHPFDDAKPSIPVGFTSGNWGSLASFAARPMRGTKKWYGTSGNSFVAVVEFGKTVRAKAVTAGGASGDPKSPHFNDQAERYSAGNLRDVYFYPAQLKGHTKRTYRPGE